MPQTGIEPMPCELPAEVGVPLLPILEAIDTSSEGGPRPSLGEVSTSTRSSY